MFVATAPAVVPPPGAAPSRPRAVYSRERMPPKSQSSRPRPSERRAAAQSPKPEAPLRKFYLAAALFLFIGDILAIAKQQAVAVVIFTVLTLMMLWIAWRVDRFIENRRPSDRPASRDRPY